MGTVKAIVVGTSFGGRVHVPALRAAGFEVAALVGRDGDRTDRRAGELGIPLASTSLTEALTQVEGPRCVAVSTPPDAHVEPVLEALAAGAHVLSEKPFALDTADAEAMVAAARDAGSIALLGCEFRWAPDEALAGRLVRDGAVGTPKVATFVQHSGLVADGVHGAFNAEWWFDARRGGGSLNASGIHVVDRYRTWLGEVVAVSAVLGVTGARPADGAEDTFSAAFHFESGCTAVLQYCGATRGIPMRICRVIGDAGSVWLDDGSVWFADADRTERCETPPDLTVPAPPPPSDDPKHAFTALELPPYTRLTERFRDLIEGRSIDPSAPATPTFDEGLRNQQVLDAMRSSSADGGRLVELAAS